jgi:stearoyl-CoA desaturase (delta-9 desaturase)
VRWLPCPRRRIMTWRVPVRPTTIAFWAVHVAAVAGVIVWGFSWSGVALALGSYFIRMFFVTAAYHRYFSHRAFKTSRWFQFVLAVGAQTAAQKGVIWWASHHRRHHKHSDTERDVHSPARRGFWYAHVGWVLGPDWIDADESSVADLVRYRELRLLNHPAMEMVPTIALALALLLVGGGHALVWGYFVSTALLWHGTFSINSLSHIIGRRRYETGDLSRNNWALALLTTGEGWHNNHHHYQSSVRQGFRWWQIDLTYDLLRLMALTGIVWDLREPPRHVVDAPWPVLARPAIGPDVGAGRGILGADGARDAIPRRQQDRAWRDGGDLPGATEGRTGIPEARGAQTDPARAGRGSEVRAHVRRRGAHCLDAEPHQPGAGAGSREVGRSVLPGAGVR